MPMRGMDDMLCQFTVKNFQCIKDAMTLDLRAAPITENEHTLLTDIDGEKFLPLSVIYGPNGAGKSTVLYALFCLERTIIGPILAASFEQQDSLRAFDSLKVSPFKFARDTMNAPSEYEIFFRTENYEYQYQLEIQSGKVVSESLYKKSLTGSRYSEVYTRKGAHSIKLKGSLKHYNTSGISDNLTLLSFFGITHRRNAIIKDIVDWFVIRLYVMNYGYLIGGHRFSIVDNLYEKKLFLDMLTEMGIDISDYRVEERGELFEIFTSHSVNGKNYELELHDESNGTVKIFGLLPHLARSLASGTTLVIDELDSNLHPLLLKYIINLFSDPKINLHQSQLIFTSHDLSTMTSEVFRRDEIWFVAKGENLASKLYSLVDFKNEDGKAVRKDARYDKDYLKGKYGADPYLKRIIEWGNQ
jgi:AAA15 family ATPase/GTPase